MHIRDFHLKFISCNEECGLLGALRRLSRLEDPQAMTGDNDSLQTNDWIVWGDAGAGSSLSTTLVTA
jgi:hypothetical protein